MVGQMKDSFETGVLGVEKEAGKVQGINCRSLPECIRTAYAYHPWKRKRANLLCNFKIKEFIHMQMVVKRIAASHVLGIF